MSELNVSAMAILDVVVARLRCLGVAAMLVGIGSACGDIHFVPSLHTPTDVEVIYSEQEDVTVIRWRTAAAPPVTDTVFELAGDNGYQRIDFARSIFPGGAAGCVGRPGSCAQYVVTGRYGDVTGERPVRAVHERLGVFAGDIARERDETTTLAMKAFFHPGNHVVHTLLADEIGGDPVFAFPRPYQQAMWASSGLCVPGTVPTDAQFAGYSGLAFEAPKPLSAAGFYCVAARTTTQTGAAGAVIQARVATLPEVAGFSHTYQPSMEVSPVLYQLVLDLEIPVADRCAAAIEGIEAQVRGVLGAQGAPLYQLPTVDLAHDENGARICRQSADRAVEPAVMAQAVKDLVASSLPERHHRYHVIYVNNLMVTPPPTLTTSLSELAEAVVSPYDIKPVMWVFGPDSVTAAAGVAWDVRSSWLAADDPSFEIALRSYADPTLPYKTEIHDSDEAIVFMAPGAARGHAGQRMKICHASPVVTPLERGRPRRSEIPSWVIEADDPPAYVVKLPPQIAVPETQFRQSAVLLRYEVCSRYCDHPYRSESGSEERSWMESVICMGAGT